MKKVTVALLLTLTLVFGTFGMASAVTDGEEDGDGHPHVGLMVAQDAAGNPSGAVAELCFHQRSS